MQKGYRAVTIDRGGEMKIKRASKTPGVWWWWGGLTDDFAYKWQNWCISAQPEVHALADLIWAYLELNYMQ